MDGARNCRRGQAAGDRAADFAAPCCPPDEKGDLQPHRVRSWLNRSDDPALESKVTALCQLYEQAPVLAEQGEVVYSTDELTGVQALERTYPDQPPKPGRPKRREFAYIRHSTCSFIISRNVVTGEVFPPTAGPTRAEDDVAAHIAQTIALHPTARRIHFAVDNLNTHQSEALVRLVAAESGLDIDLGCKASGGFCTPSRVGRRF
jgi:hypothetical protein